MLSHSNGGGGAGRATDRLFRALDGVGVDLRMHVDFKHGDDPRVSRNSSPVADLARRVRITLDEVPAVVAGHPTPELFSPATMSAITARRVHALHPDIVDVHWINFGYLSVRQLGRITMPMVWHMHDMWAFTGGENYAPTDAGARWRTGYSTPSDQALRWDVERWVYHRKLRSWTRPVHLIASSSWMAGLSRESPLVGEWPVHVIPNPVQTDTYCPGDRGEARSRLGLPPDSPVVVAVLPTHLDDPRKGFDLLQDALARVRRVDPSIHLAVVGHSEAPRGWTGDPALTHWLGRQDDAGCILAYRAADVVVVPSRQDNSPQTATEALSCGAPVVAFDATGLPDFVFHKETGYLAAEEDAADLAAGIRWILADPSRRLVLAERARTIAVQRWSPSRVADQHVHLYEEVLEQRAPSPPSA